MSTNTPGPGIDWGRGGRFLGRAGAMAGAGAAFGAFGGPVGAAIGGGLGLLAGLVTSADQDRIEQEALEAERRAVEAGASAEQAAEEGQRVRENRLAELIPDARQRLDAMEVGRGSAWDELTRAQGQQVGAYDELTNPYDELVAGLEARANPYGEAALRQRLEQTGGAIAARYGQGQDALRSMLSRRQLGAGAEAAAYSALASERAAQQTQNELATRADFGQQATAWDELSRDRLGEARRLRDEAANRAKLDQAGLAVSNAGARLNYATGQRQEAQGRLDALSGQQEAGFLNDASFQAGREAQQFNLAGQRREAVRQGDMALGQMAGSALGRLSPTDFGGVFGEFINTGTPQPTTGQMPQKATQLGRRPRSGLGQGYQSDTYRSPLG